MFGSDMMWNLSFKQCDCRRGMRKDPEDSSRGSTVLTKILNAKYSFTGWMNVGVVHGEWSHFQMFKCSNFLEDHDSSNYSRMGERTKENHSYIVIIGI